MRFLHTADIHLGVIPDRGMPWSEERTQAVWNTFRSLIREAGQQKADLLLIAGDLFHRQPLRRECKELNYLFSTIPDTRVVIIAGNHDYIRDTSPYLTFAWASNVTILSSDTLQSVWFPEINTEVHGLSYHSREIREPLYDRLHAPRDGRIHILLGHGGDEKHIPIRLRKLAEAGFDYAALGHIHQPDLVREYPIAWCGSPEPIDRTDLGPRGYILGTITRDNCRYNWYPCASGRYQCLKITVNDQTTTSQILHVVEEAAAEEPGTIFRIRLEGARDPEVRFDTAAILQAGRITDVEDDTVPEYDLQALREEHAPDLISHFIDRLDTTGQTAVTPEAARKQKALYFGLRALLDRDEERRPS